MQALPSVSARWLALAWLAAALLIVPTASAGSAAAIKGVGAGKTSMGFWQFELSAHAEHDPKTPENGFGQLKLEQAAFVDELGVPHAAIRHTVDVRCLAPSIIGGRPGARITGVITRSSTPPALGVTIGAVVADGGEPSAAPVDSFDIDHTIPPAETTCYLLPQFDMPPNVEQGNIVVKF